jgi:proteasome activator subunit 4
MDPIKQFYLYEILLENPIRGEQTSSSSCSRLYCLIGAFNQHVWRMNSVSIRLLEYLHPFLSHEFQNIRQRISTTLINIFENDICLPKSKLNSAPKIKNLIESYRNEFSLLFNADINQVVQPVDQQLAVAQRNFKTIAHFIGLVIEIGTNGNEAEYFELLPIVARFEKISEGEIEDDLIDVSTSLFAMMAQALTLSKDMSICIEKIEEVSNSPLWSIRLASLNFLQVQIFTNMPTVISKIEWVEKVTKIVLRLLEDKVLEVREKASEVLTDLIHCSFIPSQNEIILAMKKKCKTKIPKKTENDFDQELAKKVIIQRHSGVLGCCAFILSQPYTIPDYVPPLFEILSNHMNDPHPIPASIRKTIANFKRTHHDGWETHKSKFSENQLAVISELTVPPSYYS